ncbi:hypothetical protein KIN20_021361 [Parelaphostrongylus tenuis]|uniref:Uncharacterized protein n=1 Tax=Parelaphostrongylus tenuis TaxID=148309 RepID=A0AAD5QRJ3_PARTN|nr:hypothetical protein KIN20_021361 [Parelaphostrongylus tenuis]
MKVLGYVDTWTATSSRIVPTPAHSAIVSSSRNCRSWWTTSIIMANWAKANVTRCTKRAVRMLVSNPYGSCLFSASATAGGN